MLKFCLIALMSICSFAVNAQFTLSGKVVDSETQQPLEGATVQIVETNLNTITQVDGQFIFQNIDVGTVTLKVRFVGFTELIQSIRIEKNIAINVPLIAEATLHEEIIVKATRAQENSPFTFSEVDKPAIQKQNFGQDMPMLLNWTPSVVTTSDAGAGIGYTGIRIRGSDATRINVTINGIPYNDSESQSTYWVDIPDVASSTQSIQIQRGVGTSTNGASAFGASVNLQTNSMNPDPYADLTIAGGSFNSQRYTARSGTGLINKHWTFDAKVSKILSDGYVERASSDLTSYYLSGGYYGKKTILKAITFGGHEVTYQSWYGLDEATMKINRRFNYAGAIYDENYNVRYYDNQVDDYHQDHYQLHFSQKLNTYWNANASLHYTHGRGFYEEYHQGDSLKYLGLPDIIIGDSTIEAMDVIVRKWLDNKFYGTTFSFNYEKDKTVLTIGGAFNQYGHAKHYGEIIWAEHASNSQIRHHYYDGHSQKNDFNIYSKWSYTVTSKINAFVDLQYRMVTYETAGTRSDQTPYQVDEKFNFFNPKIGFSYSMAESSLLYSSYAVAHREPNRTDYLDNEVKPKPEKLGNLEVGWRKKFNQHSLDVNYYLMHYTDQLVLTGALDNVGNPIRANVGKSYRTGIEATATIKLLENLNWAINGTWAVNKNQDYLADESSSPKNTTIILSPSLIGGSQLSWTVVENFQAVWMAKYVGKQYLDNSQTEELTLAGYFINDLRFSYQLHPKGMKEINLSLLVNNLFDVAYSSNGYSYYGTPYFYPQAGVNFMAMVGIRF